MKLNKFKLTALFIALMIGLIPVIWFTGKSNHVLINGVDTNFPLNPLIWFLRRFYVWNPVANAGIDFSNSTAGLFFHFVQLIPYEIGLSLQKVELFSLIFWFLTISFSSYFFSSQIFKKHYFPRVVFVVFYSLNIYLFNSWENVKVANLCLVAGIPIAAAILYKLFLGETSFRKSALVIIITAVLISGTGLNPAYFISFFLTLFLFLSGFLISEKGRVANLKKFFLFSILIVVINSFWIFPSANFIFKQIKPEGSIGSLGFTDWVDSLSENTSLVNILRVQGAWDWYATDSTTGVPLYIPYSTNYFTKIPFLAFSFLSVLLVFLSLIFRKLKKNSLYLSFSIMILLGVFLGAGTHDPTGALYVLLLKHLPFFSLFRSPWYIFTPMLTFAYAALLSLLASKFVSTKSKAGVVKAATSLVFCVLIIGNFFYNYPLITGKVFRPEVPGGFFVEFPDYVLNVGNFFNTEDNGRILGYPDEEIEDFEWGYRGIESILSLVSKSETLFPSLNNSGSGVSLLVKEFYIALKKGELEIAKNVASKLRTRYLLVKNDQQSIAPRLNVSLLDGPSQSFGNWDIYDFSDNKKMEKMEMLTRLSLYYSPKYTQKSILGIPHDTHAIDPSDSEIAKIPNLGEISGNIIVTQNSQAALIDALGSSTKLSDKITRRDLSIVQFDFEIPEDGDYYPQLEKYKLEQFGINTSEPLSVMVDENEGKWKVIEETQSLVKYSKQRFILGKHKVTLKINNRNLATNSTFSNTDGFEEIIKGDSGRASFDLLKEGENTFLSLDNIGKRELSAKFKIDNFDSNVPYYVVADFRKIYGERPKIYFLQGNSKNLIKGDEEALPDYPEFKPYGFFFRPVISDSEGYVLLTMPYSKDPFGSKAYFDNLGIYKVFTNNLFLTREQNSNILQSPQIVILKSSPTSYEAKVSNSTGPHVLAFFDNYSDQWKAEFYDESGNKLDVDAPHFSVDLYANAWYVPQGLGTYKVKIYYQPQRLFYLGSLISAISVITLVTFFLFDFVKLGRKIINKFS